jgi:hypothetical protein
MSIGNPIIIAVTPHGPPNSHLESGQLWKENKEPRENLPRMGVEKLISLAAFISDSDFR